MIISSLLASIVPILFYLFVLWKMDKNEPEPIKFVILNFLWGAIGAVLFSLAGSFILVEQLANVVTTDSSLSLFQSVLVAPFVEEFMKGSFLLITVMSKKFDNITDGLVYGGAIGLGFGMTENFFYFVTYSETFQQWIFIVTIRTLFSALMHCIATASFGAFLGSAKFTNSYKKYLLPVIGFFLAFLIHFSWNFGVSFNSTYYSSFGLMIVFFITFYFIFNKSIKNEEEIIENELLFESETGLFPYEFISIVKGADNLEDIEIDNNVKISFVKAATKLAFRKNQARHSIGSKRDFYLSEVEKYRNRISELSDSFNF
ncbi:MAG: PrsW family intramembrane metalloprotease [Melioribacteraceae bacterium]|nr:PrsW family intramembrane metalloprotease [Melioribacteraceae bacterium]